MPVVTLSSKNQITVPIEMVRNLGLKGGDKLVAELIDDHIVLLPQPESWVDYFAGRLKGVWGETVEEIDQYIADLRGGREREEWREELDLIMEVKEPEAKKIVEYLRARESHAAADTVLREGVGIDAYRFQGALQALLDHGAVRKKKLEPAPRSEENEGMSAVYYLVREFTKPR